MNSFDSGSFWTQILIAVAVIAILFLILREVVCWYWKINQSIGILREIRDLLAASQGGSLGVHANAAPEVSQRRHEPAGMQSGLDDARKHLQNPITAQHYAEKYGVTIAQVEDFVTKRFLLAHSVGDQLYVVDRRLPDHILKPNA